MTLCLIGVFMCFTCAFVLLLVRFFCLSIYCMHTCVRWIENFIFHKAFIYEETYVVCVFAYVQYRSYGTRLEAIVFH